MRHPLKLVTLLAAGTAAAWVHSKKVMAPVEAQTRRRLRPWADPVAPAPAPASAPKP